MFINPRNGIITCKTEHRNPGGFCSWNSRNFESEDCFPFGNRNPEFWNPEYNSRNTDPTNEWNPESKLRGQRFRYHYLESGIHGVESRIQDCPKFPYMERGDATSCHPHVRKGRGEGGKLRNNASHNYIENISQ